MNSYLNAAGIGAVIGLSIIGLAATFGYTLHYAWAIIGCPVLTSILCVARDKEDESNG